MAPRHKTKRHPADNLKRRLEKDFAGEKESTDRLQIRDKVRAVEIGGCIGTGNPNHLLEVVPHSTIVFFLGNLAKFLQLLGTQGHSGTFHPSSFLGTAKIAFFSLKTKKTQTLQRNYIIHVA
jgi:hypothetical protein